MKVIVEPIDLPGIHELDRRFYLLIYIRGLYVMRSDIIILLTDTKRLFDYKKSTPFTLEGGR